MHCGSEKICAASCGMRSGKYNVTCIHFGSHEHQRGCSKVGDPDNCWFDNKCTCLTGPSELYFPTHREMHRNTLIDLNKSFGCAPPTEKEIERYVAHRMEEMDEED
jgi:hypothetical protein